MPTWDTSLRGVLLRGELTEPMDIERLSLHIEHVKSPIDWIAAGVVGQFHHPRRVERLAAVPGAAMLALPGTALADADDNPRCLRRPCDEF